MTLELTQSQREAILRHGARDYPFECCGVLLGVRDGERKVVAEVVPLRNLRHDPARAQQFLPLTDPARETARNRFLVDPIEQLRVEKGARRRGVNVLGYYHSHPDEAARPSIYDRECAWPWYSYLIVSVAQGSAESLTCWVLADDGTVFRSEPVEVIE
jgi:proteasome lid subunit RPN8/RPN11